VREDKIEKPTRTVGSSRYLEVGEASEAESKDYGDVRDAVSWVRSKGEDRQFREKERSRRVAVLEAAVSFRDSRMRVRKILGA